MKRTLAFVCALAFTAVTLSGCATATKVLRTLDDAADVACSIFATEHPTEFIELVTKAKPDLGPTLDKASLNVKQLCDMKEVVAPFLEDQRFMQSKMAARQRASMSSGGEANAGTQ